MPFTFLVLDAYRASAWPRAWALRQKAPFLALAALAGALNLYAQSRVAAPYTLDMLGPAARLALAAHSLVFYAAKTLLPVGLMPLYPMPKLFLPFSPLYMSCGAAVVLASAYLWRTRRKRPALLAAWSHYVIALLPVSGLLQGGPQLVADRYTYLACLGWAAIAGAAMDKGRRRLVASLVVALLAFLSWTQCSVWHDPVSFWSYQVRQDPKHAIARNFLGDRFSREGRPAEGEALLREALALDPSYGAAHNNLANLLSNQGRLPEALSHYEAILLLNAELVLSPHAQPTQALLRQLQPK